MPVEGRERAVTVVIGAVLMFGLLISALALYQANVVPTENEQTEWDHQNDVETELVDVRNAIRNANGESDARTVSVTLGTSYESRTFAINPPPATGKLSAVEADSPITVDGVDAFDEFASPNASSLKTSYLTYEPGYYEYESAPVTTIENSLVYNEFTDGNVTVADQQVFSRDSVSLIALDGEWSKQSRTAESIAIHKLDGKIQRTVRDRNSLNITIPTKNPTVWNQTLHDNGIDNIANIRNTSSTISVDYNDNETGPITLSISRVGVGPGGESTGQLDGISDGSGQYDLIWNKTDVGMATSDDAEHFEVTVTDGRNGGLAQNTSIDIFASHTGNLSVTADNQTDRFGVATVTVETDDTESGQASLHAAVGISSARSSITVSDGSTDPPSDPRIDVQPVTISDTDSETQFPVPVTVEETNGVATEDLSVGLAVESPDDSVVYDESISVEAIADGSATVTFGGEGDGTPQLGPFDAGQYTATITADADNADSAVVEPTFTIQPVDSVIDFQIEDIALDATEQFIAFNTERIDSNGQATIDLSDPQGSGVEYSGATATLLESGNDAVHFDADTNNIVYTAQGQPDTDRVEIHLSNIDVIGNPGTRYEAYYKDDGTEPIANSFGIEGTIPEFTELDAVANWNFDFLNFDIYSDTVTIDHSVDHPGTVTAISYTVFDDSGLEIGSANQSSAGSSVTIDLSDRQYDLMTVEVTLHSTQGDKCLTGALEPAGTVSLNGFSTCQ